MNEISLCMEPIKYKGKLMDGETVYLAEGYIPNGSMWIDAALPHKGFSATEYLNLVLSEDIEWIDNPAINRSGQPIRVFHCYHMSQNGGIGNPRGPAWESHVDLKSLQKLEEELTN